MVLKAGPENAPHPPIPFCIKKFREHQKFGPLAQLGERKVRNLEVRGSIPLCSMKKSLSFWQRLFYFCWGSEQAEKKNAPFGSIFPAAA